MGLNIGIDVKKQHEGYGNDGVNPKGTAEEIEQNIYDMFLKKYPEDTPNCRVTITDKEYQFDIRQYKYGTEFRQKYPEADLYKDLVLWIFDHFSHMEGIELRTYWSG